MFVSIGVFIASLFLIGKSLGQLFLALLTHLPYSAGHRYAFRNTAIDLSAY